MKIFNRIVLLAAFLMALVSAHAQAPIQTISWESSVKDLGNSTYEIQFKGKILPDGTPTTSIPTFRRPWWRSNPTKGLRSTAPRMR